MRKTNKDFEEKALTHYIPKSALAMRSPPPTLILFSSIRNYGILGLNGGFGPLHSAAEKGDIRTILTQLPTLSPPQKCSKVSLPIAPSTTREHLKRRLGAPAACSVFGSIFVLTVSIQSHLLTVLLRTPLSQVGLVGDRHTSSLCLPPQASSGV